MVQLDKNMETNYSFHAFERVRERISITHKELADILDADLALNIGQENKSNKVHKLFYSERDKICFVAIQDIKTGTVVTVIPIDYHENISWVVSIESQNQAKKLITKDVVALNSSEILNKKVTAFKISANVVDGYGRYKKVVKLGSWPCLPYEYNVDNLVKDGKFIDFLIMKIKEKISNMNDETSSVQTIAIRLGKKEEPVFFSTSEIIATNA